jgi:GntR family L-lactate dehydrogenase operon transcriptional regulator
MTSTPTTPPLAARSSNGSVGELTAGPRDGAPALGRSAGPFIASRELEHAVLHLLAGQEEPLGSGSLLEQLQGLGYAGSEPTVGRLLRSLDRRGLTQRVSNRGRSLTPAGRERLRQLGEAAVQRRHERELLGAIRPTTIDDLLDLLVARRALEREIARLAAEHATAEELAGLEAVIAEQRQALTTTGVAIEADVRFHKLLALAAGNRVLTAAIDLIRRDQRATLQLDAVLKDTDHKWVIGHERILRAVKRRAPAAAERAMLAHIDAIIADVHCYRERAAHGTAMPDAAAGDGPSNRPEALSLPASRASS